MAGAIAVAVASAATTATAAKAATTAATMATATHDFVALTSEALFLLDVLANLMVFVVLERGYEKKTLKTLASRVEVMHFC